jgi:hypothetical protein
LANSGNSQIPLGYDIFDPRTQKMTQPWAFWFQNFQNNLPPPGSSYVINGTTDFDTITIYIGLDFQRGVASNGAIYFATDTNKIYLGLGTAWIYMQGAFTGDVSNEPGDNVMTLAPIGTAGTYGSTSEVPVITVDSKGRVTHIDLIPVTGGAAGFTGSIQYNQDGILTGDSILTYNSASGQMHANAGLFGDNAALYLYADFVPETTDPISIMQAVGPADDINIQLLPQGVGAVQFDAPLAVGDLVDTGQIGQVLVSTGDMTSPVWTNSGRVDMNFAYGDATPEFIVLVPAGKLINAVQLTIFTGLASDATLSIGSTASPGELLDTTDNDPATVGVYTTEPGLKYLVDTPIYLTIVAGSSLAGNGAVTIFFTP